MKTFQTFIPMQDSLDVYERITVDYGVGPKGVFFEPRFDPFYFEIWFGWQYHLGFLAFAMND